MEYTLSKKRIIFTFLIMTIVMFTFFCLHNDNINWEYKIEISFVFIIIGFFYFFLGKRIYKLKIDNSSYTVFLFYRKYFFIESSVAIHFNNITFSHKEEVGARGVRSEEFRIYVENKKLFGIDYSLDGWEKKTVDEIVAKFRELGLNEIK